MYLFDCSAEKGVIIDNLLHIKEFIPEAMELDARAGLETCYHVLKFINQFKLSPELTNSTEILYKNIEDFWHKLCKRQIIAEETTLSVYIKQTCGIIDATFSLLSGDVPPFIQPDDEWGYILEDSRYIYEVDTKTATPFEYIRNKYSLIDACFISEDTIIVPLKMQYRVGIPSQYINDDIQQILHIIPNDYRKFYIPIPQENKEYIKTKFRVPEHLFRSIMGARYLKVYDTYKGLPAFNPDEYVLFEIDYHGPILGYDWDRENNKIDNQYLITKVGIQMIKEYIPEEEKPTYIFM